MKLFAIYIGGEHPRAHIEVHDVRFVAAASFTDTYEQLRAQWWGKPGTLHVDCWAEITHADGYAVSLKPEPFLSDLKLFFVNLGGYDGQVFGERHRIVFTVGTSPTQAKTNALRKVAGWKDAHRDDLYEAEQVFALDSMFGDRLHVHLEPVGYDHALAFSCRYVPLR